MKVLVALVLLASLAFAQQQEFDCEDVDHDCDPADPTVGSGIKRAGKALVDCAKHGVDLTTCDLTFALARVTDDQCRSAMSAKCGGWLPRSATAA